jgi:argininosuccinate lyase
MWMAFVESNTSGTGRLFASAAACAGHRPVVLSAQPERYDYVAAGDVEARRLDTSDLEALTAALVDLRRDGGLAGIWSSSEYYIQTAAQLAARLGLPSADADAIARCRNKYEQYVILDRAGLPVPRFRRARTVAEAAAAARELRLPVVLKPVFGTGSVGVRLCETVRQVVARAGEALATGTNERGLAMPLELLVQSYAEGPEYSLEMFGGGVVGITGKHVSPRPYFVETGHDVPARLSAADARRAGEIARAALEVLGLRWGPSHLELRLTDRGWVFMEVNPRLAGGFIPELWRLARGIDLIAATVALATGAPADLTARRRRAASIRFVLSPGAGVIRTLDAPAAAGDDTDAEVTTVFYRRPGDTCAIHHDFRDRIGHAIAAADDGERAAAAAARAVQRTRVTLEADGIARTSDTGRIQQPLVAEARRIVFRQDVAEAVEELRAISDVDRAHVVMLTERSLIAPDRARRLLRAIEALRETAFDRVLASPGARGLYLQYEAVLRETGGDDAGGTLHVARSRNDLNATVAKRRLRGPAADLFASLLRLQATLLRVASVHATCVMPLYTHGQAAVPITYGHYLVGVAAALDRGLAFSAAAASAFDQCPLGAHAGGGTSFPIDTARTAALLGFTSPVTQSVDAVASRDQVLMQLAATACVAVTLSRLATDLLQWSTAEFGFLTFPDHLVGSSSAVPQKRNPFLLEHVQGRTGLVVGAFTAAATAMHKTPFSNSIAVGTEASRVAPQALTDARTSATLLRLMVRGGRPSAAAMSRRAAAGLTWASELANRLVRSHGVSFRAAHHLVGAAITAAERTSPSLEPAAIEQHLLAGGFDVSLTGLHPAGAAQATAYGGGPAATTVFAQIEQLERARQSHAAHHRRRRHLWRRAERELQSIVFHLCTSSLEERHA